MEYTLSMTFTTEMGEKSSLSISGVKNNLTSEEASALMDEIIKNDIFQTKSGSLATKVDAKLTETKVTKYDMK